MIDKLLSEFKKMLMNNYAFDDVLNFIENKLDESCFKDFLAQKILLKLLFSNQYTLKQKNDIIYKLGLKFPNLTFEFNNYVAFLKTFFPITNSIYHDIEEKIVQSFEDSLFLFNYCLGIFVYENPDMIYLPKKIIYNIAKKVLKDDINYGNFAAKISLGETVYNSRKSILEYIYREAIKYGCIYEKFDEVSYSRLIVSDVHYNEDKPVARFIIKDNEWELSIHKGDAYNQYLYSSRLKEEPDPVHSYYKCKICRYCKLMDVDDEIKEIAFQILNRQFKQRNLTDMLYFYTGTMPSYILSILSFLYTELLILILYTEDNYRIMDKKYIRNNILFNNHISDEDYDTCISLICNEENHNSIIPFLQFQDNIIVGKWMYNNDFSIVEEVKNVSFNSVKSSKLGESSNFFGKDVFEKIVKGKMKDYGWSIIDFSIKLKKNKNIITDIDLLAFKNGIVILGQLKVANCGRSDYQIWKASEIIKLGINQIKSCMDILKSDSNLLYSILKKAEIVNAKSEIKEILPIIITSNNYFNKIDILSNISVIGLDMFFEILYYTQNDESNELMVRSLIDPFSQYSYNSTLDITVSEIKTDKYQLFYEEYE